MSTWKIGLIGKKPKLNKPILIEGLPGIGNVGKVALDFIIDELKAEKLYDIFSYTFPHSVFVNEKNLVELPSISVYYKKLGNKKSDLLLLAGDVQPIDEQSSYEFTEKMLDLAEKYNCREIITLGGIGLQEVPKKPRIFCTGNDGNIIKRYKAGVDLNSNLYGIVGPIIGVSGLLLGLAKKRNISAISLLAETYGHPLYLGIKGAREIIKILDKKLELKIDLNALNNEIEKMEKDIIKKTLDLSDVSKQIALSNLTKKLGKDMDYIG